jgi:hypothetical protein
MEHLYLSSSLTSMFSSHTMEGLSLSLMTSSFNVNFVVPPVGHVPLMCWGLRLQTHITRHGIPFPASQLPLEKPRTSIRGRRRVQGVSPTISYFAGQSPEKDAETIFASSPLRKRRSGLSEPDSVNAHFRIEDRTLILIITVVQR